VLTEFKCFLSGVKLRVRMGFYHIPIKYLKKLVLACLLIFCSEYASFVLGVVMMSCLINILVAVGLRPYRLTFEQVLYPLFDLLYLLVFLTICLMQLPLLSLSQTQQLNAGYLAIALCILLSLLLALHNLALNLLAAVKLFCGIDYLAPYYTAEYVETTEQEEASRSPLQKEQPAVGEKEGQSVISGLDIYLQQDQSAPQYLIKCLKPEE
jgi:hypothetical protein